MSGQSRAERRWRLGWSSCRNRWFYHNRLTGESSWSRPPFCSVALPRDPPINASTRTPPPQQQDLPIGWEFAWDVERQRYYYFKRATMERTWRKPAQQLF
mmetsp:Transcript_32754/g.64526  ORF Transcript_32754/g.64526 Transcript_32754/m.64526 type:complete len:100 (-) Transcript_32754:447-746(-)